MPDTQAPSTLAVIHRADYQPPAWWIDAVDLTFDLDPAKTRVLNKMRVRRNPDMPPQALRLHGEELNLARVLVNGGGTSFRLEGEELVLENLPEGVQPFELEIFTTCQPEKNTQLSGLYVSQGTFFTQCEAEGFRRITYFLDRPDVMATFRVMLRASRAQYPVLLSNGNLVESGDLPEGRHFALWSDPHRKPCYLFALVAGRLVAHEQRITSRAGREHLLQVFVREGDLAKTDYAMQSLMQAIAWDEARFGLPLDLERFMIVATSDFNMGAMENKGLNIFNTRFVLASQATATDQDFANVQSVVGHEYFHNWTGNRITCRDWFQLSLKEGLTVFRDQEFSMDMAGTPSARAVKRIEDVRLLRAAQFPEDAGPMAHPVRPESYQEINNFYTLTIYEKGAEVVRMQHNLVGREGFRRGMDLYFQRHDGQAVTCDDFSQAIADANPDSPLATHLAQFRNWYSQAGTPRVQARLAHDSAAQTVTLTLIQSCPPTPGQAHKPPFVIPVAVGLLDAATGRALPLQLRHSDGPRADVADADALSCTLVLTQPEQSWIFEGITAQAVVPSLLRGFSAPVILEAGLDEAALLTLLAHDSDAFNRWEAAQQLALRYMLAALQDTHDSAPHGTTPSAAPLLPAAFVQALGRILMDDSLDCALREQLLTLPAESWVAEHCATLHPPRIHSVRQRMRCQLARELRAQWEALWQAHRDTGAYRPTARDTGRRALAALALSMLCLHASTTGDAVWPGRAYQRVKDAASMSERFAALSALVHSGHPLAQAALDRFYALFRHEPLVVDKWFALQACTSDNPTGSTGSAPHALARVQRLMQHPDFNLHNPNRARSLIFSYCNANPGAFHRADGAGYAFWSERLLELDALNPQVAARLARAMEHWRRLQAPLREAARQAIERVAAQPLSRDVGEIITRMLDE